MARIQQYNFKDFVKEVQNRLSIIHKIEGYEIGKNRITFLMNNAVVIIRKNKDDETKTRKTIISCSEMFPCVIENDYNGSLKYDAADVDQVVNALDSYFMEELGLNPAKSAVCSRYQYLKYMLLPFIVTHDDVNKIKEVQEDILFDLIYEGTENESCTNQSEVNGTLMTYTGKNIETDKVDAAFIIIAESNKLNLFIVRYENGQLIGDNDDDEYIKHYEIPYAKYPEVSGVTAIRKLSKTHYAFKRADFKFLQETFSDDNNGEIVEN